MSAFSRPLSGGLLVAVWLAAASLLTSCDTAPASDADAEIGDGAGVAGPDGTEADATRADVTPEPGEVVDGTEADAVPSGGGGEDAGPAADAGRPRSRPGIHPLDLSWVEPMALPVAVKASLVVALGTPATPRVVAAGSQVHLLGLEAKADPDDPTVQLVLLWSAAEPLGTPTAGCAADFDGDGHEDLFLAHASGNIGVHLHVDLALNLVDPPPAPLEVGHARCGDWTGDGHADVLVATSGLKPELRVLVGNGAGRLDPAPTSSVLAAPATSVAAGDVDGDGHADVLVTHAEAPSRLLLGDGFGALLDAPVGALPAAVGASSGVLADLDGDGDEDVVLMTPDGGVHWVNNGAGELSDHTGLGLTMAAAGASSLLAADLDLDGTADVLAARSDGVAILRNDGTGRLFDYTDTLRPRPGRAALQWASPVDVDLDGDLDLVAVRPDGSVTWLRSWPPWPGEDGDGDGFPAPLDVCPDVYDPGQPNRDAWHFSCPDSDTCLAETGCALTTDQAGKAWLLCADAAASQAAAHAWCEKRGARLVVLDSLQEQSLIAAAVPGRYWIDLSDDKTEGVFLTSTGGTPSFEAWFDGQPDDLGEAGEDCVELDATDPLAAGWSDVPCGSDVGWVCEDTLLVAQPDPGDGCDVCPGVHDPEQLDSDGDGIGDACAPSFE